MDCPKCKKGEYVKAGFVKNRQRYKCKNCGYYYSVAKKSDVKTEETRRMALELYPEGLRISSRRSSVRNKFRYGLSMDKKVGEAVEMPVKKRAGKHCGVGRNSQSYVMRTKTAVDRPGKRYVVFVCGARSTTTGIK
jgi:transposase-like protein